MDWCSSCSSSWYESTPENEEFFFLCFRFELYFPSLFLLLLIILIDLFLYIFQSFHINGFMVLKKVYWWSFVKITRVKICNLSCIQRRSYAWCVTVAFVWFNHFYSYNSLICWVLSSSLSCFGEQAILNLVYKSLRVSLEGVCNLLCVISDWRFDKLLFMYSSSIRKKLFLFTSWINKIMDCHDCF